ncbi:MAG: hypothetical protein AAGI09_07970 [Pseudomonadota bacterium]
MTLRMSLLGAGFVLLAACNPVDNIVDDAVDTATQRILDILDEGQRALSSSTADVANIFNDILAQIGTDATLPDTLRDVLEYGSGIAVAQVNTGIQCQIDLLQARAREVLRFVERELQGRDASLPPPILCGAIPSTIDLNRGPSSWRSVRLFGYGLGQADDGQNRFQYTIPLAQGGFQSVPVSNVSNYDATLNLSNPALFTALFVTPADELQMLWNGQPVGGQGELAILDWQPRRVPRDVGSSAARWSPRCASSSACGDGEFDNDDGPADLFFRAEPRRSSDGRQILLEVVEFTAREVEDDRTTASERSRDVRAIYTAPDGFIVESFSPSTGNRVTTQIPEDASRNRRFSVPFSGGILSRLDVFLSTSGDRDVFTNRAGYLRYEMQVRSLDVVIREVQPPWLP